MKNKGYYTVIMAGGVGSRFWPVSTQKFPKQFHDMLGTGRSLIRNTADRFAPLIPIENMFVATNAIYENQVIQQLPELSRNNILLEPAMRNTAPCILYSALKIHKENPNAIMVVAPSDHFIQEEAIFLSAIEKACKFCSEENALVTFGIPPTHPHTGYGYIEFDKSDIDFKKVINFTEKPDSDTANTFLKKGNYLWNSGIFVWSVQGILEAFEMYLPEMYALFAKGENVYNTPDERLFIDNNYKSSDSVSIDYGIMEKSKNTYVLPVHFDWNDLGTWSSLQTDTSEQQENLMINRNEAILNDSHGNIIQVKPGKKVVIQGLQNYIVVEKDDLLFIYPIQEEQQIKEVRNQVKSQFGDEFI